MVICLIIQLKKYSIKTIVNFFFTIITKYWTIWWFIIIIYIKEYNSLLFATGATRSDPIDIWHSTNYNDELEIYLNNTSIGWINKTNIPYSGNHVSYTSVLYNGKYRHYVVGGQMNENEQNGNQVEMYEYMIIVIYQIRIKRANMPFGRGHAFSSTRAYGCGFIIDTQTSDIHYYNIQNNNWYTIENLPKLINTPVCDIVYIRNDGDYLFCQTGDPGKEFLFYRKITL